MENSMSYTYLVLGLFALIPSIASAAKPVHPRPPGSEIFSDHFLDTADLSEPKDFGERNFSLPLGYHFGGPAMEMHKLYRVLGLKAEDVREVGFEKRVKDHTYCPGQCYFLMEKSGKNQSGNLFDILYKVHFFVDTKKQYFCEVAPRVLSKMHCLPEDSGQKTCYRSNMYFSCHSSSMGADGKWSQWKKLTGLNGPRF